MGLQEKLQPFLILASVAVGLLLGQVSAVSAYADRLIVPLLGAMLFNVFLAIELVDLRQAFKNGKVTTLSLAVNFLWTPVFAWGLGTFLLTGQPDLQVGFLMLMLTPCTDWYLVFTGVARGNVALASALLPWNLILQIVLLPIYLFVFAGQLVTLDVGEFLVDLLGILVVPMAIAFALRKVLVKAKGQTWTSERVNPKAALFQSVFLNVAIAAMFASQGALLVQRTDLLANLLVPVFGFFVVNFVLVQAAGRAFRVGYEDRAALTLTTLARNSPLSLAIAVATVPDRPLIALVLVIGPLIELPILVGVAHALLRLRPSAAEPRSA